MELVAPRWDLIIPTQMLRSLMFLIVCLPVINKLRGSWRFSAKGE